MIVGVARILLYCFSNSNLLVLLFLFLLEVSIFYIYLLFLSLLIIIEHCHYLFLWFSLSFIIVTRTYSDVIKSICRKCERRCDGRQNIEGTLWRKQNNWKCNSRLFCFLHNVPSKFCRPSHLPSHFQQIDLITSLYVRVTIINDKENLKNK